MKEPIKLTTEDERRIIQWAVEYAAKYDGQYHVNTYDLRMAAEYATKYERHILLPQMEYANNIIAGQAKRIKELEDLLMKEPWITKIKRN